MTTTTAQNSVGPAPEQSVPFRAGAGATWYPPLPLWKTFLLLFATLGTYSLFFVYRCARDVRDNGNPGTTPWLYPLALPIGLAAAIASGRLASRVQGLTTTETFTSAATPVGIGILVFVGHGLLSVSELIGSTVFYLVVLVVYSIPWLLLQYQLNLIKRPLDADVFRTAPGRFTRLQIAGLIGGAAMYLLVGVAVWEDVLRIRGATLPTNSDFIEPGNRFMLRASTDGWTIIEPGYLNDESDFELLGPGPSDWAVVYIHDRSGWSVDDLVESRVRDMLDSGYSYSETRRLLPGTSFTVSNAVYSGLDPLDGRFDYRVTAMALEDRAMEIIVYTAGAGRASGRALAESFGPVP